MPHSVPSSVALLTVAACLVSGRPRLVHRAGLVFVPVSRGDPFGTEINNSISSEHCRCEPLPLRLHPHVRPLADQRRAWLALWIVLLLLVLRYAGTRYLTNFLLAVALGV